MGAIGNLLPGGRPVFDAAARVDMATAWGVKELPATPGRDTAGILKALSTDKSLSAVIVGGVDPMDISSDALTSLLDSFVVSLEISHSAVTAIADVVLPVAAVVEKRGTFADWTGKPRSFDKAIADALTRSDVRILSMIADAMGTPINLPTVSATQREIESLGVWDGAHASFTPVATSSSPTVSGNEALLYSYRQLLDLGALQMGEENLAGTARSSVACISPARAAALGVVDGDAVKISSQAGSITLSVAISEIADEYIWAPRNSVDSQLIPSLGIASGLVTVVKA
jgi:NADH-quinone oxidoreductase subunit G